MSDPFNVSRSSSLAGAGQRTTVASEAALRASRQTAVPQGPQNRSLFAQPQAASIASQVEGGVIAASYLVEAGGGVAGAYSGFLGTLGVSSAMEAASVSGSVATVASGLNTASAAKSFIKNVAADFQARSARSELSEQLEGYDALGDDMTAEQRAKASELVEKHGAAVLDSHKDATIARLTDLKRLALAGQETTFGSLAWAGVKSAAGVGIAASAVRTVDSAYKVSTGTAAISTLRAAVKKSGEHPTLMALAKHAEKERVFKGRTDLAAATLSAVSTGLQAAVAVSGGPAGLLIGKAATDAVSAAAGLGLTARAMAHQTALGKKEADAVAAFETLRPETSEGVAAMFGNKGLAERQALYMLRHGSPEDRKAVVTFLKTFGLGDKVIFGLSVMKEGDALELLQRKLYHDAVDTKAANEGKSKRQVFTSRLKSFGQMIYRRREKSFSLASALAKLQKPGVSAPAAAPVNAAGPGRASVAALDPAHVRPIERRSAAVVRSSTLVGAEEGDVLQLRSRSFRVQRSMDLEVAASMRSSRPPSMMSEEPVADIPAAVVEDEGLSQLRPLFSEIEDGPSGA